MSLNELLLFAGLGLGVGSIYAILGAGLVLTFEGTGIVNFAIPVIATAPVYVYSYLRANGTLALPVPWIPTWHVGTVAWPGALAVAMAVAAALGVAIHFLVSRPLRQAPALARVVASIGVLVTLQACLGLAYGTNPAPLTNTLTAGTWKVGGAVIFQARVILAIIVIATVAAITMWLRRTRTGLAIRAAAENEQAAELAGLSPQRLGLATWTVATMATSLIFILAGTIIAPLTPVSTSLLILPGVAAALIGRMRSIPVAAATGLLLGIITSELTYISGSQSWFPTWGDSGIPDLLPFVFVAVGLFAFGRTIPSRGDDSSERLPPVRIPRMRPATVAGVTLVACALLAITTGTARFAVIISLAAMLGMLSFVVLTGFVGQVSLAQASLAGITAFLLAKLGSGLPFPVTTAIAVLGATIVGVAVGIPALRVRGTQLAIVTLAATLAISDFVFNNPSLGQTAVGIPSPTLFGVSFSAQAGDDIARLPFGFLVLAVVVVGFVLTGNLMRRGVGRRWLAVRSNERAAASIGIDVARVKLSAFALASMLAGLSGALTAYGYASFSADSFDTFAGLTLLAVAYMGGVGSLGGAVAAGLLVPLGATYFLTQRFLHLGSDYQLFSGVGLILTVVLNPVGIAGATREQLAWVAARVRPRKVVGPTLRRARSEERREPAGAATARTIGDVVLDASNITVRFGGLTAANDISLSVRAGEIVGLVGPNGSGKTTFVDAITGFVPAQGTIAVGGRSVEDEPAHRRARLGIVRTWQSLELFSELSVRDNVRVTHDATRRFAFLRDAFGRSQTGGEDDLTALDILAGHDDPTGPVGALSLGEQKLLGVARSLAATPKVLLLDEPAAGLDSHESLKFGDSLRRVAATGVGCLLIDHDMALVMGVCDRIYVLDLGKVIASGAPEQVSSDPDVIAAYLGGSAPEAAAV
jgi:ABC-type branched-subunit amino acid transport system ATPase component/ABC-type branched-subunit amino acid transport system permease subunit